ncbi:ribonuclease Z [Brevibacillus parabrevis]|uniref:Ribonuclease Z n=1 Tax=Brevibacillus parabrevis TaxID=54914 RepID=A0A4Y3PDQ5_BREPA|nr:ribonuclease Z [Brevibacillus parabrevis]MBU8711919.1 ribonuclease Z [Brevibacillus parabrevis]MDR5000998.1 ribonuclease Z [Brevibacillus parabrevis]MED1723990.1 ribonuclease Z [Brevibacillus parabrevis]RNB93572.1 ribonuclease Z [Brevibacillus parabrevis]WDV97453.1 ribonuclease Z [Brevibacillus parabrevis]
MIVTFLGTGSGAPTTRRNVSGIGLRFLQAGKWWLFDCGEGTQHQLLRSPMKISQLDKIFITHLHGDHLYGLIGLLASRSLRNGEASPLTLYGPPGIDRYFRAIMDVSPVHLQYPLELKVVSEGVIYEDEEVVVSCRKAKHRVTSFAYSVLEKDKPGAFLVERAKEAGVPSGPLFGALKRGEQVTLADGRVLDGKDFVGAPQQGRKIVFSGDTEPCQSVEELAANADLLVHEATYADHDKELAVRSGHSTAKEAAELAKRAGVKALCLTHFSPRYEDEDGDFSMDDLLKEAQAIFPMTTLAEDLGSVEVKRVRKTVGETDLPCYNE